MTEIKEIIAWFEKRGNAVLAGENAGLGQQISRPRAIDEAGENHLTFIGRKYEATAPDLIRKSPCKLIIIETGMISEPELRTLARDKVFVMSTQPKADFLELCKVYFSRQEPGSTTQIHPSAVVDPGAVIGVGVSIGAGAVVEADVRIGDRSAIGSNTVLKRHTVIESDVRIGSNNVIGGDGFGYVKDDGTGVYQQFPHFGGVYIKEDVEIGNNTCIDRGSLKDTIIERGVKIDNLVHIAHNVHIGENSLVIACAMVAGSVSIGANCWIAPGSSIRNGLSIGANSTVGLAATVTKDVGENTTVLGSPAVDKDTFTKQRKAIEAFVSKDK